MTLYLNIRVYFSYVDQFEILSDFNNGTENFIDSYENMETDYPNISVTSMNLKSIKAKYLLLDKKHVEALELLNEIKYDPLQMKEVQKAQGYFTNNEISKMYESSVLAWETLPFNQAHLIWYLKASMLLNQKENILNAYNIYGDKAENTDWHYFYFTTAFNIMDEANSDLIKKQARKTLYRFSKSKRISNTLKTILFYVLFGEESYKESLKLSEEASVLFSENDFEGAVKNYQMAISLFPLNADNYYNKMASLFKLKKYSEIKEVYKFLPDSLNPKNGSFEFLMARSHMKLNDNDMACEFFEISKNMNYKLSTGYHKNLCNN